MATTRQTKTKNTLEEPSLLNLKQTAPPSTSGPSHINQSIFQKKLTTSTSSPVSSPPLISQSLL
jgi:hypothetical protein